MRAKLYLQTKWQQFFRKAPKQESCGLQQTQHLSVQSGKLQPNTSSAKTPAPFQRTQNHSECLDTAKDLVLL